MYGLQSLIFRIANVVGPRCNHGVIFDFVAKLNKNPKGLEVLGDGSQSKSYLYVDDCIEGITQGVDKSKQRVGIFNLGSEDRVSVLEIAQIVIDEMGLGEVDIRLTGGVDGGRGWKGDVKFMQLDMSRIKSLGWKPQFNSSQAVRMAARSLANA
jgi:UDP-glucose 4-epimerase